jgi:hypothetical protein
MDSRYLRHWLPPIQNFLDSQTEKLNAKTGVYLSLAKSSGEFLQKRRVYYKKTPPNSKLSAYFKKNYCLMKKCFSP